ncbi:hypothetical protein BROUX41_005709 [Berkeleyomyces rouxiae]|uniref:uncharacterized protein n=1 Tax=Berkeleyomyces rouxiae TaxID=2035830 RepID=UPI003B7CEAAC
MPTNNSLSTQPAPESSVPSRPWGCPDDISHSHLQDSADIANDTMDDDANAVISHNLAEGSSLAGSAITSDAFAPELEPFHSSLPSTSDTASTPIHIIASALVSAPSDLAPQTEDDISVTGALLDHDSSAHQPSSSTDATTVGHGRVEIPELESPQALVTTVELSTKPEEDSDHDSLAAIVHEPTDLLYHMGYDFPSLRIQPVIPSPYLRPGSKYHGTQHAEHQVYDVHVDIKYVDMAESYLCGYLRIQGLTPDHPKLTTFFDGEIIGPKYSFITDHESWGATKQVDISHWKRLDGLESYYKSIEKGATPNPETLPRQHIFMRWKEHFLVPDHTVKSIMGASFEGFYYIRFDILHGRVNGLYFHGRSEKYQQLDLVHIDDSRHHSSFELR